MKTKSMGQIFTPAIVVDKILDLVNYKGNVVLHTKIMEPSFGNGAFLTKITTKIIEEGKANSLSNDDIIKTIQTNVFGIEKDTILYQQAISNIKEVLNRHGIKDEVDFPNLLNADTFDTFEKYNNTFDFIVGNPPYLTLHTMETKDEIRKLHFTANGMTDIYIAFFEMGIKMLKHDGRLGYITPNSYFNSTAGKTMRKTFMDENLLEFVFDYGHHQVFSDALTYTCITILNCNKSTNTIKFQQYGDAAKNLSNEDFYINEHFYFTATKDFREIVGYSGERYCCVKNGCATLWDKFFIDSEIATKSIFSIPIIKASTGKTHKCFYPYDTSGKPIPYSEIKKDKIAEKILTQNKERLLQRSSIDTNFWYAFGRTQALSDTYKNKYSINAIFKTTSDIHIVHCKEGCAVYGGLYILSELSLDVIKNIVCTDSFIQYITTMSKYKNGGYYTATAKDIENYINFKLSLRYKAHKTSV